MSIKMLASGMYQVSCNNATVICGADERHQVAMELAALAWEGKL